VRGGAFQCSRVRVAGEFVQVLIAKKDGTHLGVVAVIPRGWCAVLCTVCKILSDLLVHIRGWEGSMASRSIGLGSSGLCSEMSFPSLGREFYSTVRMALVGKFC
jgi:hypothetical protein